VLGETLVGKHRLVNAGMVVGGKWWFDGIEKPGRTK
jgi:hypothetical protein